jgi:hypothetical protein
MESETNIKRRNRNSLLIVALIGYYIVISACLMGGCFTHMEVIYISWSISFSIVIGVFCVTISWITSRSMTFGFISGIIFFLSSISMSGLTGWSWDNYCKFEQNEIININNGSLVKSYISNESLFRFSDEIVILEQFRDDRVPDEKYGVYVLPAVTCFHGQNLSSCLSRKVDFWAVSEFNYVSGQPEWNQIHEAANLKLLNPGYAKDISKHILTTYNQLVSNGKEPFLVWGDLDSQHERWQITSIIILAIGILFPLSILLLYIFSKP